MVPSRQSPSATTILRPGSLMRRLNDDREASRDAIAMIDEDRTQLERSAAALVASEELDRLEIAAAVGEPRPRRARPEPGPRSEPALRPHAGSVQQLATSVRPGRGRLAPVLADIVTWFVGCAKRDPRAGVE